MLLRAEQSRAEQSRAEQSRAEHLDIAKGIGISLVVFRHLAERYQMLRILIYSFHMPLFFVISGVLNKNKKPVRCFQDGILKMVLPTYKVLFFDASLRYLECVFTHTSYPTLIDCVNGLLIHGGVLWNSERRKE